MKFLLLMFTTLCLTACSKNIEFVEQVEEVDSFLDCREVKDSYKAYDGEDIDCEFHYVLTDYNNQQFIELRAHCADLTRAFVINKYCEDICDPVSTGFSPTDCENYLRDREEIEILLIEK